MQSNTKRQGQQPYGSAVRPTGGGAQVFLEEFARGVGRPGGTISILNGLQGLPAAWTHVQPTGDNGASGAPAIDASLQMAYLNRAAQVEGDALQYRWNAICARLPSIADSANAWQIDVSYLCALELQISPIPSPAKFGAYGIILGEDSLLTDFSDPFYFSNTQIEQGASETAPEVWTDAQTIDSTAAVESEGLTRLFLTLLVSRTGGDLTINTYVSPDGIGKVHVGAHTILNLDPSVIGFAVRTEEPAPGESGYPVSAWCDYIRVRPAAYGSLGTVVFGQTGGRNW